MSQPTRSSSLTVDNTLCDGVYQVSFTATDAVGNSRTRSESYSVLNVLPSGDALFVAGPSGSVDAHPLSGAQWIVKRPGSGFSGGTRSRPVRARSVRW